MLRDRTNTMATVYRERDANPKALEGHRIAVIGYGNLGRPIALNLRDSGVTVTIGNLDDDYAHQARMDGFRVVGLSEAATNADIKLMLLPDEAMPEVYLAHVAPTPPPTDSPPFPSRYTPPLAFI